MGIKSLIFEDKDDKKSKKEEKVTFPKTSENIFEQKESSMLSDEAGQFKVGMDPITSPASSPSISEISCEPYMDSVMDVYQKGFDALNKTGYDFYEFYKAMLAAGADNQGMYAMALNMAKAMDPNVSKESLVREADYYLQEIEKVHKNYETQGKGKENTILGQKAQESETLNYDLNKVKSELAQLQQKEAQLKIKIESIDSKYATQLSEVGCKLQANDLAKKKLFDSINKVKQGINANL